VASTIVTKSTVRQSIVWLDVYYDLHSLFTTPCLDLRLCIEECCILWVTSFLDIRLNDVTTEKTFSDEPHLDVHKMFEKLGLTQEIGVTLDRIRNLSKGRYATRKRGGWETYLVLVHFLPLSLQYTLISLPLLFLLRPLSSVLHPGQF
jgi:hypothetical protein